MSYPISQNINISGTLVSNVLNKIIAPMIEDQLPYETVWFDMLKKNNGVTTMPNNTFYVTMRTGRSTGVAFHTEGDKLISGKATYAQPYVSAKYLYATFDITDPAIEAAKGNPGSIANVLTENARALKIDLARELNRCFWKSGDGVVAITAASGSATAAAASASIKNYMGYTANDVVTGASGAIMPNKYLPVGTTFAFATAASNLTASTTATGLITASTSSTISFTMSGAGPTWGANTAIFKVDGDASGADEPMGAQGIVDDGTGAVNYATAAGVSTFQNIARSGADYLQAPVYSTATALTESLMTQSYLKAREFGHPRYIFTNSKLHNKYGAILLSYKKTVDLKESLVGGWYGLEFNGGADKIAVILDYDVPDTEVYGIDPDSITIGQMTDVGWLDQGGGNILRRTDYAGWQGTMRWYGNLIAKNVRANFKMTNQIG